MVIQMENCKMLRVLNDTADILIKVVESVMDSICYLFRTMASDIFDFLEGEKELSLLERAILVCGMWIPNFYLLLKKMENGHYVS